MRVNIERKNFKWRLTIDGELAGWSWTLKGLERKMNVASMAIILDVRGTL